MPTPSGPRSCSTNCWSKHRAASGVVFHAMHPGWADTPGVRESLPRFRALMGPLLRTPSQGADTMVWLATDPRARDERAVLAGPPAAIRRPAAGHPHQRRRCRAMLELVRRPRGRRCAAGGGAMKIADRRHRRVRARRGPHAPPSPRDHRVRVRHTNRRSCQHRRRRGRRPVGRGRHGIHRVQRSQLSRVPCTARSARRRDATRRR